MNPMATCSNIETLPEDCVCSILSYLSPAETCRFSIVSPTLHLAADSDMVWKCFLPCDYEDIVSRAVNPLALKFSSYKHLFYALCRPLLLDNGNKACYLTTLFFQLIPCLICFQQAYNSFLLYSVLSPATCRASNWTSLRVKYLISYLQGSCL